MKVLVRNPPKKYAPGSSAEHPPHAKYMEKRRAYKSRLEEEEGVVSSDDSVELLELEHGKLKKPYSQRLQSVNPFRLSRKYSRLDLWTMPLDINDENDDMAL